MPLSNHARYLLSKIAAGKSLCFSQDGDLAWLSNMAPLPPSYDSAIQELIKPKLIDCRSDPEHWTEANCFNITDAGRKALARTR